MHKFFLFFIVSLLFRIEAFEYRMAENVILRNHTNSIPISTELLDSFVEKGLLSVCMITDETLD